MNSSTTLILVTIYSYWNIKLDHQSILELFYTVTYDVNQVVLNLSLKCVEFYCFKWQYLPVLLNELFEQKFDHRKKNSTKISKMKSWILSNKEYS